jgi:AraC-like DNA-binding protein
VKDLSILNDLSELINIRINSCNLQKHEADWREQKIHKDYDVWLIKKGHVCVEINATRFDAHTGDIVVFFPEIMYSAYTFDKECEFIFIHFDFRLGNNNRILNDFNLAGVFPNFGIAKEAELLENVYDLYVKKKSMSSLMLKGAFVLLIAALMKHSDKSNDEKVFTRDVKSFKLSNKLVPLEPVFTYITKNISRPIDNSELSSIAGMSEKYFITYFKKVIGISPARYVSQIKMNRARDLLYEKRYSIKEIAYKLGYADQYSFSKAFKKYYNVAPTKFF